MCKTCYPTLSDEQYAFMKAQMEREEAEREAHREQESRETAPIVVAEGVKLLDEIKPGWRSLVDRDLLDISSPSNCIAGQVFQDEAYSEDWLNGYGWFREHICASTVRFGLCGGYVDGYGSGPYVMNEHLQEEWIKVLNSES